MGLKQGVALLVMGGLVLAPAVQGWERRVKLDDVPPAVKRTVLEVSKGLELRGVTREVENGQVFYEAELKVEGRTRDVIMDEAGAVVLIEEQVAWESVPAAVRAAIEKGAEGRKILLVESLTRNDAIEAYEAHIRKWWREIEIRVDPEGNRLDAK
jgi:hypothetical protein